MDPAAFAVNIERWSNFFLAEAGASAALLGLLFVGVSINLNALALAERADVRARAEQAFANLLYVLAISLILLVPDSDPSGDAIALVAVSVVGLVRVAGNIRVLRRAGHGLHRGSLRRFGWTLAADALLLYVGATFWTAADSKATVFAMAATLVLLFGAADTSWDMLVEVSREAPVKSR